MEKVWPWCGHPSYRGRLKNRTEQLVLDTVCTNEYELPFATVDLLCSKSRVCEQVPEGTVMYPDFLKKYPNSLTTAYIQGVPKSEATNIWPSFCQILTDFHFFSLEDAWVNL